MLARTLSPCPKRLSLVLFTRVLEVEHICSRVWLICRFFLFVKMHGKPEQNVSLRLYFSWGGFPEGLEHKDKRIKR